jgi:hypothetical protein
MKQRLYPGKILSAEIGEYADYVNISNFNLNDNCECGARSVVNIYGQRLCDGCKFRHAVMKAAGREQEFWDARDETYKEKRRGWVSYRVKYSARLPPD